MEDVCSSKQVVLSQAEICWSEENIVRKVILHDAIERNLSQVHRGLPGLHPAMRGVYQGHGDGG
jgi:hypothetical protein